MKIIKRLAFVLGMLVGVVSVGMGETESNKIDNKIKEFCGDSGISKCISFYESSCNSGNFLACEMLDRLDTRGFDEMADKNYELKLKFDEFVCQNYNGSTADIEKIILNLIKYAKEIGKFLAENNVAETSSAMQEMARIVAEGESSAMQEMAGIVAEGESIVKEDKTSKRQTEFKQVVPECRNIGKAYIYGRYGIKQDIKKGTAYLKKSCDYGDYVACYDLGYIYSSDTWYGIKNLSLAKKYYEKACDLGNKHSCGDDCWAYKSSCDEYIKLHQKGAK